MRELPNEDDFETDTDTTANADTADGKGMTPTRALITAALKTIKTGAVRAALASAVPTVVLITTPTGSWTRALAAEIERSYANASTIVVMERKKDGNEWVVSMMLENFADGDHVVICSPDPAALLPPMILAAADARLVLPFASASLLRHAIRALTGEVARGLRDADVAGLDMTALTMALRPGSSAADCVRRLRQLSGKRAEAGSVETRSAHPLLEDLPLPTDLAAWAQDTVDQLKLVASGAALPATLRYGVLEGPPGTGKTLVAGAIARSAGWQLVTTSIGDWFTTSDGHLGGVNKACAAFFDALQKGDCVVGFLDEIDALPDRATLEPRDRQWWTTVITHVLNQVDRLRASGRPVLLLAATNYVTRIDSALLRRMEGRITVRAPQTEEEVLAIFVHYLRGEIDPSALSAIIRFTLGATPASIESFVRAARSRARSQGRGLMLEDILWAVVPEETRSAEEVKAVAVHEAGHATVAEVLGIGVKSVSVLANGVSGGVTQTMPLPSFLNRDELEDLVTVYLAGRAADVVVGNKGPHSGAAIDLEMATMVLTRGICEWGLYDTLIHADCDTEEVFDLVQKGLKRLLTRAVRLVTLHRTGVVALAEALVTQSLLTGEQVAAVLAKNAAQITKGQVLIEQRPQKTVSVPARRSENAARGGSNTK